MENFKIIAEKAKQREQHQIKRLTKHHIATTSLANDFFNLDQAKDALKTLISLCLIDVKGYIVSIDPKSVWYTHNGDVSTKNIEKILQHINTNFINIINDDDVRELIHQLTTALKDKTNYSQSINSKYTPKLYAKEILKNYWIVNNLEKLDDVNTFLNTVSVLAKFNNNQIEALLLKNFTEDQIQKIADMYVGDSDIKSFPIESLAVIISSGIKQIL